MNTIIDLPALKRLCLHIVHRAVKDKDVGFFHTEYAEEICSAANLNRLAIIYELKKGTKPSKSIPDKAAEKTSGVRQAKLRGGKKQWEKKVRRAEKT